MQAALPRIAKAVGPFAGMTILFVPDVLFRPQPALLSHRQDQLQHVCMPLAVGDALFDVQHERAARFKHAMNLLCDRHEPFDIPIDRHLAIGLLALVGIGWRGDDQIGDAVGNASEQIQAIADKDFVAPLVMHVETL